MNNVSRLASLINRVFTYMPRELDPRVWTKQKIAMPQTCILVDDEPLAREKLALFINKIPSLELVASFENAIEVVQYLSNHTVDILFLDIQMQDLTGIEMLRSLPQRPRHCIITTAYSEWAVEGFTLQVTDYLLKPYSFERFVQAVGKTSPKTEEHPQKSPDQSYMFVKTDYKIVKVDFASVLYIEGMRDYRCIVTPEKKILTLQTFTSLEQTLPQNRFCRVHKSYMVNYEKIESIERHRIKIGEKRIPISERYRSNFYENISLKPSNSNQ